MATPTPPSYTSEELMILEVFEHPYTVQDVFSAHEFPREVLATFQGLVEQGRSIDDMEAQYEAILGNDYKPSLWMKRRVSFVAGMTALLGTPRASDLAVDYILNNLPKYQLMSRGIFNGASKKFESTLGMGDPHRVPNFCRDQKGMLRDGRLIDKLIFAKSDCYALLMSALAHTDAEGVEMLMGNASFFRHMPRSTVLKVVNQQMSSHPHLNLEQVFSHYFNTQSNESFMSNMKLLCETKTATLEDFRQAFWPGAAPQAIDQHVGEAVKFDVFAVPQPAMMLQVFRENGVDLYPGVVLREEGWGVYYDAISKPLDMAARHDYLMNFASRELSKNTTQNLAMLLVDIPLEKLKAHLRADLLLKHLYDTTKDRLVLMAIEDKRYRGDVLEDALGL
jgi:hypothetical protein